MIVTANSETTGTTFEEKPTFAKQKSDNMGKDQFLTLLIAQIKNQDPMNPMENTEFTAQMAQFSSLEQLFTVNENLNVLATAAAATNSAQSMNLLGKEVTVQGRSTHVTNGIASEIGFTLPSAATDTSIHIEDAAGNVVRTIELGPTGSGNQSIKWDGRNNDGVALTDGVYNFTVLAEDGNEDPIEADTFTKGIVDKVSFENNVGYIHIGDKKYMLGEVLEISELASSTTETETEETDDLTDEEIV